MLTRDNAQRGSGYAAGDSARGRLATGQSCTPYVQSARSACQLSVSVGWSSRCAGLRLPVERLEDRSVGVFQIAPLATPRSVPGVVERVTPQHLAGVHVDCRRGFGAAVADPVVFVGWDEDAHVADVAGRGASLGEAR